MYLKKENEFNNKLSQANQTIRERDEALEALRAERDALKEENRVSEARIKALRLAKGERYEDDEFTDHESFDELEMELEAFVKFYEDRWGKAKKKIRKKLLNYQSLKGQNRQDNEP